MSKATGSKTFPGGVCPQLHTPYDRYFARKSHTICHCCHSLVSQTAFFASRSAKSSLGTRLQLSCSIQVLDIILAIRVVLWLVFLSTYGKGELWNMASKHKNSTTSSHYHVHQKPLEYERPHIPDNLSPRPPQFFFLRSAFRHRNVRAANCVRIRGAPLYSAFFSSP